MPAAQQVSATWLVTRGTSCGLSACAYRISTALSPGVVLHQRKGHQHRVPLYFRKPKRSHALLKDAHDREADLAHPQIFPDRVFVWEKQAPASSSVIRQTLLRDCSSMASRNRPWRISRLRITWKPSVAPNSETACSVPPVTTLRKNACDVAATAITLGRAGLYRLHVRERDLVASHHRLLRIDFIIRVDEVGSYALDLPDDVAPAGHRHGHHQDDAGAAYDHAERGQNRA